jgi:hypothetical protein
MEVADSGRHGGCQTGQSLSINAIAAAGAFGLNPLIM